MFYAKEAAGSEQRGLFLSRRERRQRQEKNLRRSVLLSLTMAMGLTLPQQAEASEIIAKDGANVASGSGVHNIYAQDINGDLAISRYQKFNLTAGDIANLFFRKNGGADVSTLANFVNAKIDINGTVNAIRGGKIGGHLLFLSPNGIAVGASGVINAGQFTGLVMNSEDFRKLYEGEAGGITLDAIKNAPYNNAGKLTVDGHINTTEGILLGGGIINIGSGAKLQSVKQIDFSSLVNTGSHSAGLGGDLTATVTESGDIVLSAKTESKVSDKDGDKARRIRWGERSTDLTAAVTVDGSLVSDSSVKISAESTSSIEDSTPMTLTDTIKGIVLGENEMLNKLTDKLADKEAAANKYLYVNYSGKSNKTSVKIGDTGSITAKSVDIAAKSDVKIKQSIAVPKADMKKEADKTSEEKKNTDSSGSTVNSGSSMPVVAVGVTRIYNNADIDVKGAIDATGSNGIKIAAKATTDASLEVTASGSSASVAAVGVGVLTGDTDAKVALSGDKNFTAVNGKAVISADTDSKTAVSVKAEGQDASYISTTVGVVNYDTAATTDIARNITAGAIDIAATNKISKSKLTIDNTLAVPKSDKKKATAKATEEEKAKDEQAAQQEKSAEHQATKSDAEKKSESKSADPEKLAKDSADKAEGDKSKDAKAGMDKSLKSVKNGTAFAAGVSVGVVSSNNDASVKVAKGITLKTQTAGGDNAPDGALNLAAKQTIAGEDADSFALKVKNSGSTSSKVKVEAAVLVSSISNTAKVIIASDETHKTKLDASGALTANAAIEAAKYGEGDSAKESAMHYQAEASTKSSAEKKASVAIDGTVSVDTLKNTASTLIGEGASVKGMTVTLGAGAATNAAGTYGATDENGNVAIGGTVGIEHVDSQGILAVGRKASIEAPVMTILTSNNALNVENKVKNAGKGEKVGISGMLALSYGDANSLLSWDDEASLQSGNLTALSSNSVSGDTSARTENSSQYAFGLGVGISNFTVNTLAMVGDNGNGLTEPAAGDTNEQQAAKALYQGASLVRAGLGDDAQLLGNATNGGARGTISAGSVSIHAISSGMMKADGKAAKNSESTAKNKDEKKDSEKWTLWSKKGETDSKDAAKKSSELEEDTVAAKNNKTTEKSAQDKTDDAPAPPADTATESANKAAQKADPDGSAAPAAGDKASKPSTSFGLEGSVALNFLDGGTNALVDHVNITLEGDGVSHALAISSSDLVGAMTTAGTSVKNSLKPNGQQSATKVGIGGTYALTDTVRENRSVMRDTVVTGADEIKNSASRLGINLAAGMGVASSVGNGTNVAVAGVVYHNVLDIDSRALLIDNTVTGTGKDKAVLENTVQSTDFQITGGLDFNRATGGNGTQVGVGGAVAISDIDNTLESAMIRGTVSDFSKVDVTAQKGTTQLTGAAAGTAATGDSGYSFEGAFAYGDIENSTRATMTDTTVKNTNAVNIKAGETGKKNTSIFADAAEFIKDKWKESTGNDGSKSEDDENKKQLEDAGVDTTGTSYVDTSTGSAADAENTGAGAAADEENEAKAELGSNRSTTVTAAIAGGWGGSAGAGVGISYNHVDNFITSKVSGATITADTVNGEAASMGNILSVGAGVAIGGKTFNGAGSGSWNDLRQETKAIIENAVLTAGEVSAKAQNDSNVMSIAGEIAAGKGIAAGLTLSYNALNNTTGAYLYGSEVTGGAEGTVVTLDAKNDSQALSIAGGVNVVAGKSAAFAANGAVGLNRGRDNTESVIDGKSSNKKLTKVKNLSVTATDTAQKTTVAGGIMVGGAKVAVGGAVAYADLGSSSDKEKVRAEIKNADIETIADSKIMVKASDTSKFVTVAGGFGVQFGSNPFHLQGAAAVTEASKDTIARLADTKVSKLDEDGASLEVAADSKHQVTTVGSAAAVGISTLINAAVGLSINKLDQDTTAEISSSPQKTIHAGRISVTGSGDSDILSIGAGAAPNVMGAASIGGSASYNYLSDDVTAKLVNPAITSTNNVGVVAKSDERLANYAGALGLAAGGNVGVGAAVAVNELSGNTTAKIEGGTVTAKGSDAADDAIAVHGGMADDALISGFGDSSMWKASSLFHGRQQGKAAGIVVDSSATHSIASALASAGIAISGSAGVGLAGTVNVNTIGGRTDAQVINAALNDGNSSYGDVAVKAADYTNLGSFTVGASIGGGLVGVSVGSGSTWNTIDRKTKAEVKSSADKKVLKAQKLTVAADSQQATTNLTIGAAIAGGKVAVSAGNGTVRHILNGETTAAIDNMTVTTNGDTRVNASHESREYVRNISGAISGGVAAVGVGAGISLVKDGSTVSAMVKDSTLTSNRDVDIDAENQSVLNTELYNGTIAVGIGAAVAGDVAINKIENKVTAAAQNSTITARNIGVAAKDELFANTLGLVSSAGLVGTGVSVVLNTYNTAVNANVEGSRLTAGNDISVAAESVRDTGGQVAGVNGGAGLGVTVNVIATSLNEGITDNQLSRAADENGNSMGTDAETKKAITKSVDTSNAVGKFEGDGLFGMDSTQKEKMLTLQNQTIDTSVASNQGGVHAIAQQSSVLTAGNTLSLTAKDKNDIDSEGISISMAAGVSAAATSNIIKARHDTDVTVSGATLLGRNITLAANQGQKHDGLVSHTTAVTAGMAGVGVGYSGVVNKGSTDVVLSGATIGTEENKAGAITILADDSSKASAKLLGGGGGAINVLTSFSNVDESGNTGITFTGTNNLQATGEVRAEASKQAALLADTQGVGAGGAAVAVNHATIADAGAAAIAINGKNNHFSGSTLTFAANQRDSGVVNAGNTTVSILGVSRMRGLGDMDLTADVTVGGGLFDADNIYFGTQVGKAETTTIKTDAVGRNISAVAVAPDSAIAKTKATSKVTVAKEADFKETATLTLSSMTNMTRDAHVKDVTVGAIAVGSSRAESDGEEHVTATLEGKETAKKLKALTIRAQGSDEGRSYAQAGGGGIGGYIGASANNKTDSTVRAELSGAWKIDNVLSLTAAQKDVGKLTAHEGHGAIVGMGGTFAKNDINSKVYADVRDGSKLQAGSVSIGTANAAMTAAYDGETYTLQDYFGGAIAGNVLESDLLLNQTGKVLIGKNAKIVTRDGQQYVASTDNDLTQQSNAKGGGAVAVTVVDNEAVVTADNTITVEEGAVLSNEEAAQEASLTLSAYDNEKVNNQAEATIYAGVAAGMGSTSNVTMNRTNTVTVKGQVSSAKDVNLYAGADALGKRSNLKVDSKAAAYNYTVIPITVLSAKTALNDNNTVNVTATGLVRSTQDINATATGGNEDAANNASKFSWVNGGSTTSMDFLSSIDQKGKPESMKHNVVKVDGTLLAGTAAPINITINGQAVPGLSNGLVIDTDDNDVNRRVRQGIKTGDFDYANALGARLVELNNLISAYSSGDTTALAGYIQERDMIQEKMKALNLYSEETVEGGYTVGNYLVSGQPVSYVEIPAIKVSGGNINVKANYLAGTGSLRANSAPQVSITNNSNAYLKLNDIIMGEEGGKISFNDTVVPVATLAAANQAINTINKESGTFQTANFAQIYGTISGTGAPLSIQNTYSGGAITTLTPEQQQELQQKLAEERQKDPSIDVTEQAEKYQQELAKGIFMVNDVEVAGKLENALGEVIINNTAGDIIIDGGTQEKPTGIHGTTVRLTAKGSINQGYTDGIVHINGNPENYLAEAAENLKKQVQLDIEAENSVASARAENPQSTQDNAASGYIAGKDVYIAAEYINVNGTIQSGYKDYKAELSAADVAAAKQQPRDRAVTVQNRTMYKVNDGGQKYDADAQAFYYEVPVYYDPLTDHLIVEDINTQGGKVYLTGRIASTGNGKIIVSDGAADISVLNHSDISMDVGQVINNIRSGSITIADTAKDTWTEYSNGRTRSITGYANYLKTHKDSSDLYGDALVITAADQVLSDNHNLVYDVVGQQYGWTTGNATVSKTTYQTDTSKCWWGAYTSYTDQESIKGQETESHKISSADAQRYNLPEGAYLSNVGGTESGLNLRAASKKVSESRDNIQSWVEKSGLFGWRRHYYTRWDKTTGSIQTYQYSIDAGKQISLGLLGTKDGSITLKNDQTTGGDMNLLGKIQSATNLAPITINANGGSIKQAGDTSVYTENLSLAAHGDIAGINVTTLGKVTARNDAGKATTVADMLNLSAQSNGKGNIDITVHGGQLEGLNLAGNVKVEKLASLDGDTFAQDAPLGLVSLQAQGDITQSGTTTAFYGRGISLASENGSLGTTAQPLTLAASDFLYGTNPYSTAVNASAAGSVYLTESVAGGDFMVGKITAKTGDVVLTAEGGGFVDMLPTEAIEKDDSTDELVKRWIDAGLIDGEKNPDGSYKYKGAYIEQLEKDVVSYRTEVENAYASYATDKEKLQQEYDSQLTAAQAIYQSADYQNYLSLKAKYDAMSVEQLAALIKSGDKAYADYAVQFGKYHSYDGYATADAFMKDSTLARYQKYATAEEFLAHDMVYQSLRTQAEHPKFRWTKDMMLYAVADNLVNGTGGSVAEKAANIVGDKVTLTAYSGIGKNEANATIIKVEDIAKDYAKLRTLLRSNASDVSVIKDDDGNITAFSVKAAIPLGVYAKGELNVKAAGNTFVSGRTNDQGNYSAMQLGKVDTGTGNLRLAAAQSIWGRLDAPDAHIIAGNLELSAIAGDEVPTVSIGKADNPLTVKLSGDLVSAKADKDIYIKNMDSQKELTLGAMYAADTISLSSPAGYLMSDANSEIAESYINAGKTLVLANEGGIIGTAVQPLRILNNRAVVNLTAADAYIKGMNNSEITDGTLTLGNIDVINHLGAESQGHLFVGQEEKNGHITAGKEVALTAAKDIELNGWITLPEDHSDDLPPSDGYWSTINHVLKFHAGGSVVQNIGSISSTSVGAMVGGSVDLQSPNNSFDTFEVIARTGQPVINGDILLQTSETTTSVGIENPVNGTIDVNVRDGNLMLYGNLQANGRDGAEGNISLSAAAILGLGTLKAADDIFVFSQDGLVIADLSEKGYTLDAGRDVRLATLDTTLAIFGDIHAGRDISAYVMADEINPVDLKVGSLSDMTKIEAGGDVSFMIERAADEREAVGNITLQARVLSEKGSVDVKTDVGEIAVSGNIKAQKDIELTANNGSVMVYDRLNSVTGDIYASTKKGNIVLGDATNDDDAVVAYKDVSIETPDGVMYINGKTEAQNGNVSLMAGRDVYTSGEEDSVFVINNQGKVVAGGSLTLKGRNGDIFVTDDLIAKTGFVADIEGQGAINFGKDVVVTGDVLGKTESGDITICKNIVSRQGDITLYTNNGDISVLDTVQAIKGDVSIVSQQGNLTMGVNDRDGLGIIANDNIVLDAMAGYINILGTVQAKEGVLNLHAALPAGEYQEGEDSSSLLVAGFGKIISGDDMLLHLENGDMFVTDSIQVGKNLTIDVDKSGGLYFCDNVVVNGNLLATTEVGDIDVVEHVSAKGNVDLQTENGYIRVGKTLGSVTGDVSLVAGTGNIIIGISDKLRQNLYATTGSVEAHTGKGDIIIGDNGSTVDTIFAKQNIGLRSDSGAVKVYGRTVTDEGDISMAAASDTYTAGISGMNIIIAQNGALESGRDLAIEATNGDIHITDKIHAERDLNVTIKKQGSIYFDTDVESNGGFALTVDNGGIDVGRNIKAVEDVKLHSGSGSIRVGSTIESSAGDVLIRAGVGDIDIGDNGPDVNTIYAKGNVEVTTGLGAIDVHGRTMADTGNVEMATAAAEYTEGSTSFHIDQNGQLIAGKDIDLTMTNGDLHVSDLLHSGQDIKAAVKQQGNMYFDTDVVANRDIDLTVDKGILNVGRNLTSGNDINMSVQEGTLSVGAVVAANKQAKLQVEDGMIDIGEAVRSTDGDIWLTTTTGDIRVGSHADAKENLKTATGSIYVHAGSGNIDIGNSGPKVATISSAKDVDLQTLAGTITVHGKTSAGNDVRVDVQSETYTAGEDGRNLLFDQNGQLLSGQAMTITTNNGDIHVTDRLQAGTDLLAAAKEQGSIYFDTDVAVNRQLTITADQGNIEIGRDVTAGSDVNMLVKDGNIIVGRTITSDAGDVLLTVKKGDVQVGTGVQAKENIKATMGNAVIRAENGNIDVGNNGAGVNTIVAGTDVDMKAYGNILVHGKTLAGGDVDMKAVSEAYQAGEDGRNFIIDQNGEIESGKNLTVITQNGDMHVSDRLHAGETLTAKTEAQGDIFFDSDVEADKDLRLYTENGSIEIGKTVSSKDGNIHVETQVGDIRIGKNEKTEHTVYAANGSIYAATGVGSIDIGNNGVDVDTITAAKDIEMSADIGAIKVHGKTSANGNITLAAASESYTMGEDGKNFIIDQNGKLISGLATSITTQNGDMHVSDRVQAGTDLTANALGQGGVYFDTDVAANRHLNLYAENGDIVIGKTVSSAIGDINMETLNGDIRIGKNEKTMQTLYAKSGNITGVTGVGSILIGDNGPDVDTITANKDIALTAGIGNAYIYGKTHAVTGNAVIRAASSSYDEKAQNIILDQHGRLIAGQDVDLQTVNGDLRVTDRLEAGSGLIVATENQGNISFDIAADVAGDIVAHTDTGNITIEKGTAGGNIVLSSAVEGEIHAGDLKADEIVYVQLKKGDLYLDMAQGKGVLLLQGDNTEASHIGTIEAAANSGVEPDVMLSGNYIDVDSVVKSAGNGALHMNFAGSEDKLIAGNVRVGDVRSDTGTYTDNLWVAGTGEIHVGQGDYSVRDALVYDKLHIDNPRTSMAIYGRTPTHDGERVVYWNNSGWANSKTRTYGLSADGTISTKGAILIRAAQGSRLHGDTLSVVDMMEERLTLPGFYQEPMPDIDRFMQAKQIGKLIYQYGISGYDAQERKPLITVDTETNDLAEGGENT